MLRSGPSGVFFYMEEEIDGLLATYLDLLNEEGPQGPRVQAFVLQHEGNERLRRLMKNAREVQALFHEGWLRS